MDYYRADLVLADAIYTFQGGSWSLKKSWLLEDFIHKDGRTLVGVLVIFNLTALISTWFITSMKPYRRGLGYLLTAVVFSMLLVSGLKAVTHIDCPWSYQRYGGDGSSPIIFHEIFGSGVGRCFPSGHASGGYAWVALYFLCLLYWPKWRYLGLGFGLALGATFGIAQQFRGAHLLSHDIWTLATCWFTSLMSYSLSKLKKPERINCGRTS